MLSHVDRQEKKAEADLMKKNRPLEQQRLRLLRQGDTRSSTRFSLSGKESRERPQITLPKLRCLDDKDGA